MFYQIEHFIGLINVVSFKCQEFQQKNERMKNKNWFLKCFDDGRLWGNVSQFLSQKMRIIWHNYKLKINNFSVLLDKFLKI